MRLKYFLLVFALVVCGCKKPASSGHSHDDKSNDSAAANGPYVPNTDDFIRVIGKWQAKGRTIQFNSTTVVAVAPFPISHESKGYRFYFTYPSKDDWKLGIFDAKSTTAPVIGADVHWVSDKEMTLKWDGDSLPVETYKKVAAN